MSKKTLLLVHQRYPVDWNGNWIYIGRSFSILHAWEQKIGENTRISITENFKSAFKNGRAEYLEWTEKQKVANDDSLLWWMSHLAGRNNMVSFLYESICQIKGLEQYISEIGIPGDKLLVVCENMFLAKAIELHFQTNFKINATLSLSKGKLYDWLNRLGAITIRLIRELYKLFRYYVAARRHHVKKIQNTVGEIFLIHQCLDTKSFEKKDKLTDRYFTDLPAWLEEKGHTVKRLPWLFNVQLPLNQIFIRLRQDDCLVIEDHLSLKDYLKATWLFLLSAFASKKEISYPGLNIKPLLSREQFYQASSVSNLRFWLYSFALKKWAKDVNKVTLIDTFELMPAEHAQVAQLRKSVLEFRSIGYYHSLVSKEFLGYWFSKGEWHSSIMPDIIITNGGLGKKILEEQGMSPEKVIAGPALRQTFVPPVQKCARNSLLLLCPFDLDSAFEAICKLQKALKKVNAKINVQVKAHPMMNRDKIVEKIKDSKLPEGWQWNDMEISGALSNAECCVVLASAGAYDAILHNCIVITLQRELAAMGNFLDCLESEFPILKEVPDAELPLRLEEVFGQKRDWYIDEFRKVRDYLDVGLNPVSDERLSVFEKNPSNWTDNYV
jgi:hypothetical protein